MSYKYYRLDENSDIVLWHYLNIKYLRDILNGKLYMRRVNQFKDDDSNECGMTYIQGVFLGAVMYWTPKFVWGDDYKVDKNTIPALHGMEDVRAAEYYIKCFYMGDTESQFMWQNYAKDNGVVVKTSLTRLKRALNGYNLDNEIIIGKVKYRKPNRLLMNFNKNIIEDIIMTKDIYYKNERELRVALHKNFPVRTVSRNGEILKVGVDDDSNEKGDYIDFNPIELIDEIVLSKNSFNNGFIIDGKVVDAKEYVQSLVRESKFFNTNQMLNIRYSTFNEIPIKTNKQYIPKENLVDKGAKRGIEDVVNFLSSGTKLAKEVNSMANSFLENLPDNSESPMYIPYDSKTGDILTACLSVESALEVSPTYLVIKRKEHSRMLAYPNNWVEGFKVNVKTGKIEDRSENEILDYKRRQRAKYDNN